MSQWLLPLAILRPAMNDRPKNSHRPTTSPAAKIDPLLSFAFRPAIRSVSL
jgi:hypothetical protein